MTDPINVPVSAPGATQASGDMLKAAAAAKALADNEAMVAASIAKTTAMWNNESAILNSKVTPALARARKEAHDYAVTWGKMPGMGGGGGFPGGGGGHGGGGGGGHSGMLNSHSLHAITRSLSMFGGETGHVAHLIGRTGMMMGTAMGGVALGLGLGVLAIKAWLDAEKERLDAVIEETKMRDDLNKTLKESKQGQEDRAKSQSVKDRDARRFIVANSLSAGNAKDNLDKLDSTGEMGIEAAMAKFLKSRQGGKMGFNDSFSMALQASHTGLMTVTQALDTMSGMKGHITMQNLLASTGDHKRGRKKMSWEEIQAMGQRQTDFNKLTGLGDSDEAEKDANEALMREGRNAKLIMPSANRDVRNARDPVAVAKDKFVAALEETLVPLRLRAKYEDELLKAYKEDGFYGIHVFGRSDSQILEQKTQQIASVSR